jgi:6-phosphofructokinase 1
MKAIILTGGGDAPGLNAVLRGFVRRSEQLSIEVLGSEDGFEGLLGLYGARLRRLDAAAVRGILPKGGSILGCSNRTNPMAVPLARGSEETRDASLDVVYRLRDEGVDALVLVGGEGTMRFAHRFIELGVRCVGVPKTIDNDLAATEQTFGFDTALHTATWAIDALHSTAEAHDRVMIVEVMGRDAGWIALCSGIGGGADVVLIPEIPYDVERVVAKIRARAAVGTRFTIIVVAEGARPLEGAATYQEDHARPGQPRRLGGAGQALARALEGKVEHEIRVTVLGHLQRGGSPSPFDRILGTRMGVHAADLLARGDLDRLVVLQGTTVRSVPFAEVPLEPRTVNPFGQLCATAHATGIELGAPLPPNPRLSLPPGRVQPARG